MSDFGLESFKFRKTRRFCHFKGRREEGVKCMITKGVLSARSAKDPPTTTLLAMHIHQSLGMHRSTFMNSLHTVHSQQPMKITNFTIIKANFFLQ